MPAQQVSVGRTKAPRSQNKVTFARAQNYATYQSRRSTPSQHADYGYYQQESCYRADLQGQKSAHGDQQIKPRHSDEDFRKAHGDIVNSSAIETGDSAQ